MGMKVLLAAAVFLVWTAQAAADIPELEAKLPTPVAVYCVTTDNSYASPGVPVIHLAGWACDLLLNGGPDSIDERVQMPWLLAVHTLYHEWWHIAFNETDEKLTDCGAWAILPYVLKHYWHMSAKQIRSQMRQFGFRSHYAPLPCG